MRMRGTRPRSAFRRLARAGFTLIEIMVVVIILGIIAGVMIPNLGGSIDSTRLETASGRIAELLDYCYNAAVATGRVHGVIFSPDGRQYKVVVETPPDAENPESDQPTLEPVKLPGMIESPLPDGIKLAEAAAFEEDLLTTEEGEVRVLFFPDGTTEFANLTLSDDKGAKRVVKLNGLSGTISVEVPSEGAQASEHESEDE